MIVVTTPAGAIGQKLLQHLVDRGKHVRVVARDAARIPPATRERIEVIEGSHGDADVVNKAFAGADSVFWLAPPDFHADSVDATYAGFTQPACEAIRRHGVKRVVAISALGRGTPVEDRAGLVTSSHKMCDLIAATGVAFRALVLPSFMDNVLRHVVQIREQGILPLPRSGEIRAPHASTGDIAAAAARLLGDRSWSGQEDVAVLGPEDLSFNDMAEIMAVVLGKPVRFRQVPIEAYRARLLENGVSAAMTEGMVDMMTAKDNGLDNGVQRTPENSSPTSFRQWCEDVLKPAVLGQHMASAVAG
jgi:uncharacterized protein YbjT (DUF2867 family)